MTLSYVFPIALCLLYGIFYSLKRNPVESFGLSILAFVPLASVSSLAEVFIELESRVLFVALPAIGFLIFSISRVRQLKNAMLTVAGMAVVFVVAMLSQILTRVFALSSVAFTDGHTLMIRGQELASGELTLAEGTKALKRGFGLSAIQAQGLDGEYLVGFMPLVLVAAFSYSAWVVHCHYGSLRVTIVTSFLMLPIVIFIEAIARHWFLMNTHSYAWLLTAVFLGAISKLVLGRSDDLPWGSLYLCFSAIGFLRLDYLVLFSVFWFFIAWLASDRHWVKVGAMLPVGVVSSMVWILPGTKDFPFFGSAGLILYSIMGVALPVALALMLNRRRARVYFESKAFWAIPLVLIVASLPLISWQTTISSLLTNMVSGEGLWGGVFASVMTLIGIALWQSRNEPRQSNWMLRLLALSVLTYLLTKSLDNFELFAGDRTIVRIGFGDSLNRSLINWLPFLFLVMGGIQKRLDTGPPSVEKS